MYHLYIDKWISFAEMYSYRFPALTMDSSLKDSHRYAFELAKAAREMPVSKAEELIHIKALRFRSQIKTLKQRLNKKFR